MTLRELIKSTVIMAKRIEIDAYDKAGKLIGTPVKMWAEEDTDLEDYLLAHRKETEEYLDYEVTFIGTYCDCAPLNEESITSILGIDIREPIE